jgi:hypothetical protein
LGGNIFWVGVRGDEKLNDMEARVGVAIEEGLADRECGTVDPSDGDPLYNEPMLENR